jgi:hypothetical protein
VISRAAVLVVALSGCDRVFGLDLRDPEIDAPIIDAPPADVPRVCAFEMPARVITVSTLVSSLAAADVIGDDAIDLVVVNTTDGTVTVVEGVGDGTFVTQRDFNTGITGTKGVAVLQLGADALPDLVTTNNLSSTLSILLGTATGFATAALVTDALSPNAIVVGQIDGNGPLDVAVTHDSGSAITLHLANGAGGFFTPKTLSNPGSPRAVAIADVDGDTDNDVIGASENGTARVFFNGGQAVDLAFASFYADVVQVFENDGNGQFSATAVPYPVGTNPIAMLALDVTLDGILDLVTANAGAATLTILAGDGAGGFPSRVDIPAGNTPSGLASARRPSRYGQTPDPR